jgi:hypothetical protein
VSHSRDPRSQHAARRGQSAPDEQSFTCIHCKLPITWSPLVAGVQNRNHCPYCLWSRHLDWRNAGDRLASCKAGMAPVGLTTKRGKNKYARERDGELMIIHRCTGCDKVVINRIAADDSDTALLELFTRSCDAGPAFEAELAEVGVSMLAAGDRDLVLRRLFGGSAPDDAGPPAQQEP